MSWTDERVEILKKLWGEGKSASEIAKELGNVTRNAVIGKVHRMGLKNRAGDNKPSAAPKKEAKPAPAPKVEKEKPVVAEAEKDEAPATPFPPIVPASNDEISEAARKNAERVEQQAKKLGLMQLTERTCKWPIGDPATEDFWFCGHPSQPGKPYCEAHVELAFQAPMSRRDRR